MVRRLRFGRKRHFACHQRKTLLGRFRPVFYLFWHFTQFSFWRPIKLRNDETYRLPSQFADNRQIILGYFWHQRTIPRLALRFCHHTFTEYFDRSHCFSLAQEKTFSRHHEIWCHPSKIPSQIYRSSSKRHFQLRQR